MCREFSKKWIEKYISSNIIFIKALKQIRTSNKTSIFISDSLLIKEAFLVKVIYYQNLGDFLKNAGEREICCNLKCQVFICCGQSWCINEKLFLIVCFNCINILLCDISSKTKPVFLPNLSYTVRVCSSCSCQSFFLNLSPLTADDATDNSSLTVCIQVLDIFWIALVTSLVIYD